MKYRIHLSMALLGAQVFLGNVATAALSPEDEAALTACGYVQRSDPFRTTQYKESDVTSPEAALNPEWTSFPSESFNINDYLSNPRGLAYHGALCEIALQNAAVAISGTEAAFTNRCQALGDSEIFKGEMRTNKNSFLAGHTEIIGKTGGELEWCSVTNRDKSPLIRVACSSLSFRRRLTQQSSAEYIAARQALKDRCGLGDSNPARMPANLPPGAPHQQPYPPVVGQPQQQYPGAPQVVRRYVMAPQMGAPAGPCQGQAARVLQITPPGGGLYTVANALVAGFGAYLSYKGGRHADDLSYKIQKAGLDARTKLGYPTNFFPGQMWGQGGMPGCMGASCGGGGINGLPPGSYAVPGGYMIPANGMHGGGACMNGACGAGGVPAGLPPGAYAVPGGYMIPAGNGGGIVAGGGACGTPPFNTGYTGCAGGIPGMPGFGNGSGCPGGACGGGTYGNMPGYPNCIGAQCNGQGGFAGPCPGGNCGGLNGGNGFPGPCPGGNCGPWAGGPNGNPYMNGPAHMGQPGAYGQPYSPYALDMERQRLQALQNQMQQQQAAIARARDLQNQLGNLGNRYQNAQRDYYAAQNGYNGILASIYGPGGVGGHPGSYGNVGPCGGGAGGMPGTTGCGAAGMPMGCGQGGQQRCSPCVGIMCYPGNVAAYSYPPQVVGNYGFGNSNLGYPRSSTSFNFGVGYSQYGKRKVKQTTESAR